MRAKSMRASVVDKKHITAAHDIARAVNLLLDLSVKYVNNFTEFVGMTSVLAVLCILEHADGESVLYVILTLEYLHSNMSFLSGNKGLSKKSCAKLLNFW